MNTIEPCYCCGEIPTIFHAKSPNGEDRGYFVACDNFECEDIPESDRFPTKSEAIENWNSRMRGE